MCCLENFLTSWKGCSLYIYNKMVQMLLRFNQALQFIFELCEGTKQELQCHNCSHSARGELSRQSTSRRHEDFDPRLLHCAPVMCSFRASLLMTGRLTRSARRLEPSQCNIRLLSRWLREIRASQYDFEMYMLLQYIGR